MRRALHSCVVILCLLAATAASAHTRSLSYSNWTLDDTGASVRVRVPLLELSRLGLDPRVDMGTDGPTARYLADHLNLFRGEIRCRPTAPPAARSSAKGWASFQWRVACSSSGDSTIESRILLREAPSHMHFARIEGSGVAIVERVLFEGDERWQLGAVDAPNETQSIGTSFLGYVTLGVQHILTGWDHLAFVVALLLLAARFAEVATLVTAFTVAHSVTLALAVLGWVQPVTAAVEAVIGFSIALVAAENVWLSSERGWGLPAFSVVGLIVLAALALFGVGELASTTLLGLALFTGCHFALLARAHRPARLRAAVAFAFGLVHGFGFAGVLSEMALPTDRLVPALFGFNVGVELGQLGVVILAWPALRLFSRASSQATTRYVVEACSAGICGLGLYWFVLRTLS